MISIEDSVAEVTVNGTFPEIFPKVAVIVAVPFAAGVTCPLPATVATPLFDDLHVTSAVISRLFLSEYIPEAVNCWVGPTGILKLGGLIVMETSLGAASGLTLTPPQAVSRLATPITTDTRKKERISFMVPAHRRRRMKKHPKK